MNLADVLMEHGAKFTAMKAAEKSQDDGNIKQNKAVLLAARKGARAGPPFLSVLLSNNCRRDPFFP